MRNLLTFILLTTFLSCTNHEKEVKNNLGKKVPFQQTSFSSTCDLLEKNYSVQGHGRISIDKTNSYIAVDSLIQILFNLKQYDIYDGESFDNYLKECNGLKTITWNSISNKSTSLEKLNYKISIELDNGNKNNFSITDYNIHRTEKPNHIYLRIINDNIFEKLIIDNIKYNSLFEDRLLGLEKAIAAFDSLKTVCNLNTQQ